MEATENKLLNSFDEYILCSDCFKDYGLILQAQKIGINNKEACINCCSTDGSKLTGKLIQDIASLFFVQGTISKSKYGACPIIQFNYSNPGDSFDDFSDELRKDMALIESKIGLKFFYYGPRLWMVGENEPLKSLQRKTEQQAILDRIINEYPSRTLHTEDIFYRLRINPGKTHHHTEYDSPPENIIKNGRLESKKLPILYCSQDIETCIHECRTTAEDNLYIAVLNPTKELKVIDLAPIVGNDDETEFESLDIAIHMLFMASKHSYKISREIALEIYNNGFDGLIYPSYFSTLRTGATPLETILGISIRKIPQLTEYAESQIKSNIALFGRPIQDEKVTIKGINRIVLKKVIYDYDFGPVEKAP